MAMSLKRKEAEGQFDLFGGFGGDGEADDPFGGALDITIPTADWSKSERLVFERDMLGLYVSDHPLHGVEHVLTSHADTPIAEINAGGVEDGANVTIAGILTAVGAAHEQAGRALGDRHAGGPRVRHRGAVLPEDLGRGARTRSSATRSSWSRAGSAAATTSPRCSPPR